MCLIYTLAVFWVLFSTYTVHWERSIHYYIKHIADVYSLGADEGDKLEDGVFDIITEEEVSGVYDSDSLSFATACSPGHGQQGAAQL